MIEITDVNDDRRQKRGLFDGRPSFLISLFLVLTIIAVYGQVKNFEFINFDDPIYVTENRYVQQGLTVETLLWSFTDATRKTNYWAPLTWLSILLDYELYGMNPGAFHLTNVFFHILNTLLLFVLLRSTTGAVWRSAFVAALFALHPLHVESVAWVTERKDVLSTFFWFLTLLSYGSYVRRPGVWRYFQTLFLFILGMMAKPMLVTLPFVLILLDYWPIGRFDMAAGFHVWKKRFLCLAWEKAPFFIVIAIVSVATFLTQQEAGAVKSLASIPLDTRVTNMLVAYVSYIGKMFWPTQLSYLYPHPGDLAMWKWAGAFWVLGAVMYAAFRIVKARPYIAMGWLWYLGTLFPVSGLVVIGPHAMADRYTYIPLIGLFIIISWGGAEIASLRSYGKKTAAVLSAAILLILSIASWRQASHWRNSITLFKHAIAVTENNLAAHINLGAALVSEGRMEDAAEYNLRALQINPNHAEAHHNLGFIRQQQGHTAEAFRHFKKALEINPEYVNSYTNLGNLMVSSGKSTEALNYYKEAIRINPKYAKAHYNMGTVLLSMGKQNEAIYHFRAALKIDPVYAEAHHNLGIALFIQGKIDEALFHFSEAVRILPRSVEARNNLMKYQAASIN